MLKESLVYIRKAGGGEAFVGCGAFVEQNLIVTCRHVWRDAGEQAEAVFPHAKRGGSAAVSPLIPIDLCKDADGEDPDLVLLRATDPPEGLTPLQIARDVAYECGDACALARLPTRETDDEIPGAIGKHIDAKRRRRFTQSVATGYWFEKGSSGSPVFVGAGQQLAGLVSLAELGDKPQNASIRVAYVVPGTIIWPFVRAVAKREYEERLERERNFEIALRVSGNTANFHQALAIFAALGGEDRKAIETGELGSVMLAVKSASSEGSPDAREAIGAGERGGNPSALVDDQEADRAFAQWERSEAERRAGAVAEGIRILNEGAQLDMLRRDFRAAAKRYARIIDLEYPAPSDRLTALRAKRDEFYVLGRDKGLNTALEVAIELARLELEAMK